MKTADFVERARALARRHEVRDGERFRLADHDPDDTGPFESDDRREAKEDAREMLEDSVRVLREMQDMLYAQDSRSMLLVLQAMDAAGKDGAIKHAMSGINPQGCSVHSFKAPSAEELDHDFLWRCAVRLPARGMIGIFNRSYYEETLVVRVHPELLARQRLPRELVGSAGPDESFWEDRFASIRRFERHLARNGTVVRKVFLHLSRDEQRRRFLDRIDDPAKNWKFSEADVAERAHWDAYMRAYEAAIRATAREEAPWFVVPADSKWYARLVVASVLVDAMASVDLHYPVVDDAQRARLAGCREQLVSERR
jgi:PPK2 family polyphosphate:nucleotide phosphotransferase